MDSSTLSTIYAQHKWLAFAAFATYWLVRLLKSDTKIPIDIAPKFRAPLALALGVVLNVTCERVVGGKPIKDAALEGLLAAMIAIVFGHNLVVDSMRGGKELPVPWLMVPGASPSPGKPPSIPPPPSPPEEAVDEQHGPR